jgi:deoxyadenosine/deoxycytidine kinase
MAHNNGPIIISIEGNIGSGKSTMIEKLRNKYENDNTIHFVEEPIHIWNTIKDNAGVTILEKYYADQHRYAFSFQMMAYISRLSILRSVLKNKTYKIIFIERSVYTDVAVFAKMLYDTKKIEEIEYNIYMKWFYEFIDDFPPIRFVYLRTTPEIAIQRVLSRGRKGEAISHEYMQDCHDYHENWLMKYNIYNSTSKPLLILNANSDISEKISSWIQHIEGIMV